MSNYYYDSYWAYQMGREAGYDKYLARLEWEEQKGEEEA